MERNEIIAKLTGLRNSLESWLKDSRRRYFDPQSTQDLFERFVSIRGKLKTLYPSLFEDLPFREVQKSSGTSDYDGRGYIERHHFDLLLKDVKYCLDVLLAQPTADISSIVISREGVFFAGQYFDALQRITGILELAHTQIDIIDAYVNSDVLNLLTGKKSTVSVNILTKSVDPALKVAAIAFNKQYGGLAIRMSKAFHDRFVIIDNKDFYHFGASIKDVGKRGFMFSRIEEEHVIKAIQEKLSEEWKQSTVAI
ncbi:MAG TPA: hypothetical protein PKU99_02790 [Candidatus Saccharicenans sp.]|nr:hypothetical protein [Candidatus Saccharicenans sp.]